MSFAQSPSEIGKILTEIGLEVEGMEEVQAIPGGLDGLVVGSVLSCEKHPNADRLSLTTVDVGADSPLQIVCGAPNVAAGQKVAVATVGATLYPTVGEPFVIKKGKIRGERSEGMICAEDEIGLGDSHEGIMVLAETAIVGTPLADHFGIDSDYVYEIGLTPNRSDAVGHLGVAKDLFAALKTNYAYDGEFQAPYASEDHRFPHLDTFAVEVLAAEACPRYAGVVLKGITNGESPEWLRKRLLSIGVKSINAVVDITNYILHEFGQPLHAFDYDKINGQGIVVRTLKEGTKFTTLDGVERVLRAHDLMICDAQEEPMCMAGVYGGLGSGVTSDTKAIFLESAYFEQQGIRRTSMGHNLRTDAAKVYEKGSDPNICLPALHKAIELMVEVTGAQVSSDIVDVYPSVIQPVRVELSYEQITRLIGVEISPREIRDIVYNLDITILEDEDDVLLLSIPTNKPEVTRPADVIEEIIRIYGFDKIPVKGKIHISAEPREDIDPWDVQQAVSRMLSGMGFMESMGLSLTSQAYLPSSIEASSLIRINNTSNLQLDIMRPSMLCTMTQVIEHNINRQQKDLKLYEFGRVYQNQDGNYVERNILAVSITGKMREDSWSDTTYSASIYYLKTVCKNILHAIGIEGYKEVALDGEDPNFVYGLAMTQGQSSLARMGLVDPTIMPNWDVKQEVYYAELDWDLCLNRRPKNSVTYGAISKMPSVDRDLSIEVPTGTQYIDIERIVRKSGGAMLKGVSVVDVYQDAAMKAQGVSSYSLRLWFENPQKTLTDKEIDSVVAKLLKSLESQLNIKLRS